MPTSSDNPAPEPEASFRYQAFISYSSKDTKVATWLHRKLESYRVPRSLAGQPGRDGPVAKTLVPVFRDRDELPLSSDLGNSIEDALRASAYLIVLCSPAAAASRWVNEEIRYFKLIGREDRIFAVIVDGVPNGSDNPDLAEQECFPLALCHELASDGTPTGMRVEPLAGDLRPGGDGKAAVFLKAVAGIIGVGYDALAKRQLKRRRRRQALLAGLALVAGLCAWIYNRTSVVDYAAVTSRWGVPEGIVKLSAHLARHRSTNYRVESSRAKVRRVLRMNGEGRLKDDPENYGAAVQELVYRENGAIGEIRLYDHNHQFILREIFSEKTGGTNGQNIEIKRDIAEDHSPQTDETEIDFRYPYSFMKNTRIVGFHVEYSPEGLVKKLAYIDAFGHPLANAYGIPALTFGYNALGLAEVITNLNWTGEPTLDSRGVAVERRQFDGQGNMLVDESVNLTNGLVRGDREVARRVYQYDEAANLTEARCFGVDGEPDTAASSRITVKYDEHGDPIEKTYLNLNGQPTSAKFAKYARVTVKRDERGNLTEAAYFDADSQPVPGPQGSTKMAYTYDSRDKRTEEIYLTADGKPMANKIGVAKITHKYNDLGKIIERANFGLQDKRVLANGYFKDTLQYDDHGNITEDAYFGVNDQPVLVGAVAKTKYKYNEAGSRTELAYFGINGQPVIGPFRVSKRVTIYDESGQFVGEEYFNVKGQPMLSRMGAAKELYTWNERGNKAEMAYFGVSGRPILLPGDGARIAYSYNELGQEIEADHYGLDGKLLDAKLGAAKVRSKYDENGNRIETAFFDANDKPFSGTGGDGTVRFVTTYDADHRPGKTVGYDKFGAEVKPKGK